MVEGLLSFLKTPEGQGLLSAGAGYMANASRTSPVNSLGRGALTGLLGYGQALDRVDRTAEQAQQRKMRELQFAGLERQNAQQVAQQQWLEGQNPQMLASQQALAGGGGPTVANAAKMPAVTPQHQMLWEGARVGAVPIGDYINSFKPKEPKYTVVDGNLVRTDGDKPSVAFTAPPKAEATPSSVREYEFARGQGFQGSFEQWQLSQKRAGASSNSTNVTYGAPVAGIGPDGNPVFFQPPNRAGQPPQIIPGIQPPKIGEEMRERTQQRATTIQGVEDSLGVLDKAISHPGRTTATGLSSVLDPRNIIPGTQAKDFQVLKDQIGGKAFLQAFESLKGGGQITQVEGEKATAAIARLNTAQSDKEYLEALNEFRGIVSKGYERLAGKPYQAKTREASGSVGGAEAKAPSQNVVQKLPTNVPRGSRARDLASGEIMVFDGMRWKPE